MYHACYRWKLRYWFCTQTQGLTGKYYIIVTIWIELTSQTCLWFAISVRSDKQYVRFCFLPFRSNAKNRIVIASVLFCEGKFQVQLYCNFFLHNVSWNGNTPNNKQHIIYINIFINVYMPSDGKKVLLKSFAEKRSVQISTLTVTVLALVTNNATFLFFIICWKRNPRTLNLSAGYSL